MIGARVLLLPAVTIPAFAAPCFVQCHDSGGKTTRGTQYNDLHWNQVRDLLATGVVDSFAEKQAIRQGIQPLRDCQRKRQCPLALNPELAVN